MVDQDPIWISAKNPIASEVSGMILLAKIGIVIFSAIAVLIAGLGLYTAWESLFGTSEIGIDD